jgi:nucleoside-diphosphate-sugar epimerase
MASGVDFSRCDCRDESAVQKAFKGCDIVVHMAAHLGGHRYINENAYAVFSDNVSIDTSVFRACTALGVERLIYPSSSCVYPSDDQNSEGSTLMEAHAWKSLQPDCAYGWGKIMGELALSNTPIKSRIVLRLFGVYGDGSIGQVVPDLIQKVMAAPEGGIVAVQGDGSATRAFMFIDDVMDAYTKALALEMKPGFHIVNVGHTEINSIRSLVKSIINVCDRDVIAQFDEPLGKGGGAKTADVSEAKRILGWEANTSLMEGLQKAYALHAGLSKP